VGCLRHKFRYLFAVGPVAVANDVDSFREGNGVLVAVMLASLDSRPMRFDSGLVMLIFLINKDLLPVLEVLDDFGKRLFDPFFLLLKHPLIRSPVFVNAGPQQHLYALFLRGLHH
jgi:hypothetical protein